MPRLKTAEQHPRPVNAPSSRLGIHRGRRTAQKHGSRDPAGGLYGAKSRLLGFQRRRFGPLTVDVAVHHRIPAGAKVVDQFIAGAAVVQRQAAGQDHQILVVILPQAEDDLGHQLQHATGALEALDRGPLLIELGKHFRVDRVALQHAVKITGLLRFLGHFGPLGHVGIGKGPADLVASLGIPDFFKQPPPHDLEGFLWSHGLPERLHPVEDRLQRLQGGHATRTTGLAVGFRQRRQHHSIRHELGGFRQRLNETQIAVVRAPAERLTLHKLTDVNDQLIQQHHARRIASQQGDKHLLAGRRSVGVGFLHQCKPLGLAELPRQFTPERADGLLALFPRLTRRVGGAVQDRDLRLWHIHQAGLIEECGNADEVAQRTLA